MSRTLTLALGGDEGRWLYLELEGGRAAWTGLLDPAEPLLLQELYATSPEGEILHPGEVPIASELTLSELLRMVEEELGGSARIDEVRLRVKTLPGQPDLLLYFHDERCARLESTEDGAFAPRLARLTRLPAGLWLHLLAELRERGLTERYLQVTAGLEQALVLAFPGAEALAAGRPGERAVIPLPPAALPSAGA